VIDAPDGGAVLPVALPLGFGGLIPVTGGEPRLIAAGIAHTCALTPEGGVQCWGNNDYGQLGDGTNIGSNVRVEVLGIEGGVSIVAGGNHTCVLESNGSVWCWGENTMGQLGNGTTANSNVPVKVLDGAVDVTAGIDYTCAVMESGEANCWGNNDQGQLANGSLFSQTRPTIASLIAGVSGLTAGQATNCGITEEGKVACWSNGQGWEAADLTDPSTFVMVNRFTAGLVALYEQGIPVEWNMADKPGAQNLQGALFGDGGLANVCVLKDDGSVLCWGLNDNGELGDGTNTTSMLPTRVKDLQGAYALAVGEHHSCVLNGIDEIQCWGLNSNGQLGDASYNSSNVPVIVK
jgi:alpha-tubulin suppressor-like RCC1 family protein